MHLSVLMGLLLALACALGASVSGLWKQKGAAQTQDVDIRRPIESAVELFRGPHSYTGSRSGSTARRK